MSRYQIIVAAFLAGTLAYTFGPDLARRVVARFRPEPLAPYSRYQGMDL
jgi:hypothetical protein